MEQERPSYYAIIPANVRYDEDLKPSAKLLYGEITALSSKYGVCYASNNYFARLYKVDASTVSRWVDNLKDKEYIAVEYIRENDEIKARAIRLVGIAKNQYLLQKDGEGYCKKVKENNTSINNIERIGNGISLVYPYNLAQKDAEMGVSIPDGAELIRKGILYDSDEWMDGNNET